MNTYARRQVSFRFRSGCMRNLYIIDQRTPLGRMERILLDGILVCPDVDWIDILIQEIEQSKDVPVEEEVVAFG